MQNKCKCQLVKADVTNACNPSTWESSTMRTVTKGARVGEERKKGKQ